MLLLNDLREWAQEPLDSLVARGVSGSAAEVLQVATGLTQAEQGAVQWLSRLFPSAVMPTMGRVRADAALSGWLALAVVDSSASSQYDALLEMTRNSDGLPGPLAALALHGRGFHGNRGRPWLAERGNLHLSCVLPVDLDSGAAAPVVSALAAVAVCEAMRRCAPGLEPRLKWVNDILLGGAKVGGVLSAAQSRGGRMLALTFGIGVNVAVAPAVAPTLFVSRVACINDHPAGRGVTVGGLALALLDALRAWVDELRAGGPQRVVSAYREICGDIGRVVGLWPDGSPDADRVEVLPPPLASGRLLGLTDDLALVIEGTASALNSGRLAHLDG